MKRSSALPAIARSLKRGFLALSAAVLISTQAAGCGEECQPDTFRCADGSLEWCEPPSSTRYPYGGSSDPHWFQLSGGCNSNGNAIYSNCTPREIIFDCNYIGETWQHSEVNSREECERYSASCGRSLLGSQWVSTTFESVEPGLKALLLTFFGGDNDGRADVQVDELHSKELYPSSIRCSRYNNSVTSFLDDELIARATRRNIADDREIKMTITALDREGNQLSLREILAIFCYDQPIE